MAVPAEELGEKVLGKHRRARKHEPRRFTAGGKTYEEHKPGRIREVVEPRPTPAPSQTPASSSSSSESKPEPAPAAGDTGGWQSALFLLVGSGLTLWLLLSGHLKAAGESLGWLPLPAGKKATQTKAKAKK